MPPHSRDRMRHALEHRTPSLRADGVAEATTQAPFGKTRANRAWTLHREESGLAAPMTADVGSPYLWPADGDIPATAGRCPACLTPGAVSPIASGAEVVAVGTGPSTATAPPP